jgi:dCTP deaminase
MLLCDAELMRLVQSTTDPLLSPPPKTADWYDDASPVQPASIDLHIGKIYRPGGQGDSVGNPVGLDAWILESGQTAVIRTRESARLSSEYAGIGFPPSRVSVNGILMTNPGHLDPGYRGPLHLTVINMARDAYQLRAGDLIVTLLIFKIAKPVADFTDRYHNISPSELTLSQLNKLSPDFARFEERAEQIARTAVDRADLAIRQAQTRITWRVGLITAVATIVIALITAGAGLWPKFAVLGEQIKAVDKKVDDRIDTNKEIQELEQRVHDLEMGGKTSNPRKNGH